jgi:hypothetical protein
VSGSGGTSVQRFSPRRHAVRAEKRGRARYALSLLAVTVCFGLVALTLATPHLPDAADAAPILSKHGQTLALPAELTASISRDDYGVTKPEPPKAAAPARSGGAAPHAGTPDPGSAQAIAQQMLLERGMGDDQFSCLVALWNRESHWNVYAGNPSTGAYGIPQALPGSKMASAGADWADNPATQITWGLGYITGRYGDPCGAWAHSQSSGWY